MMHKLPQRVLVIGCSGAGKSTLSRQLAEKWELPLFHLDSLYWQAGWTPTPKSIFREKVTTILETECWLMDGNFDSTLALRAQYADMIIFLDFPRTICLGRVLKRVWMYRGQTRPDMAAGCPEKVDMEFIRFIWTFRKKVRPGILDVIRNEQARTIILQSPKEVSKWVTNLPSPPASKEGKRK